MEPNELRLPQGEYVATLPTGFEKIWKILWSVDPPRLERLDQAVRTNIGKIAINYQITVSKTLADLHKVEAKVLQDIANELKLG